MFDRYDKDRGGKLGHSEILSLMVDMYRSINKSFNPSRSDVEGFAKLLDFNKDGSIDVKDLEGLANKNLGMATSVEKTTTSTLSSVQK